VAGLGCCQDGDAHFAMCFMLVVSCALGRWRGGVKSTIYERVFLQLSASDKQSRQSWSSRVECSSAIDYLVCSVIDKVKQERQSLKPKVSAAKPSRSKASADDPDKGSSSKRSADVPDHHGSPVKRRRLADTPYDERPLCVFYLEGNCHKVRKPLLIGSDTMFIL